MKDPLYPGEITKGELSSALSFARPMFETFSVLAVIQVMSVLISVMTARILGPAGKGIVAVAILYPTLLFTLGHLSVYRALTIHVGEKKYSLKASCGTMACFIAGISVLLIGGFMFFYSRIPALFLREVSWRGILLALSILPCFLTVQIYSSLLQTQGKIRQMNIINIVQTAAALAAMVIFLYVLKQGPKGAIASYFLANLLAAAGAVWFISKIVPWPWSVDFGILNKMVTDGIKLHFGVIGIFLFLKIDQLMLNYYRSSSSVGFYTVAVSLADLLLLIPAATQNVFYSKITSLLSDKEGMTDKIWRVYRHSFLLLSVYSLFLALVARFLIVLFYGRPFLPALAPFFILLPGVFFLYLNNVLINGLVTMRRFAQISAVSVAGAFLNVLLNRALIPRYDAAGAALASTITYVAVGLAIMLVFLRASRTTFGDFIKKFSFSSQDFMLYRVFFTTLVPKTSKR